MHKAWLNIPEMKGRSESFAFLLAVEEGKCNNITQLSERLCRSTAAMTGTIDTNERLGLVKRVYQTDRRVKTIILTKRGKEIVQILLNELL